VAAIVVLLLGALIAKINAGTSDPTPLLFTLGAGVLAYCALRGNGWWQVSGIDTLKELREMGHPDPDALEAVGHWVQLLRSFIGAAVVAVMIHYLTLGDDLAEALILIGGFLLVETLGLLLYALARDQGLWLRGLPSPADVWTLSRQTASRSSAQATRVLVRAGIPAAQARQQAESYYAGKGATQTTAPTASSPESQQVVAQVAAPETADIEQGLPEPEVIPARPLEDVLEELDGLIGLGRFKNEVRVEIARARTDARKRAADLSYQPKAGSTKRHAIYVGPPGTGKTMVARLHAEALHSLGLSNGRYEAFSASSLGKGHIGQTGETVLALLERNRGGVVFIDEVKGFLGRRGEGADLGMEAVTLLLDWMENKPDCPTVLIADYTQNISKFLAMDTGMPSRFRARFTFEPYNSSEMFDILSLHVRRDSHQLTADGKDEAREALADLDARYRGRASWASGRVAADLYQWSKRAQEVRLDQPGAENDDWSITDADVREGVAAYLANDPFPEEPEKDEKDQGDVFKRLLND
jgi:Mrp family chromosome partitioning ATPase